MTGDLSALPSTLYYAVLPTDEERALLVMTFSSGELNDLIELYLNRNVGRPLVTGELAWTEVAALAHAWRDRREPGEYQLPTGERVAASYVVYEAQEAAREWARAQR